MSYLPYLAVFLLVISPLLIPIGVTVLHTVRRATADSFKGNPS